MDRINKENLKNEVILFLRKSMDSDYANSLADNDLFLNCVREDIEETSAWEDEGYYSDGDILLAIGRVILQQFGIDF